MSQAHALRKEKRGQTTSIHPADSIAEKRPQCTKLLAAGLYVHARGDERLGSTNAPRLKYGAWMATPPTPVTAPLRSQNGWRLEAPSHLESTRPGQTRARTRVKKHTPAPHATRRHTTRDSTLPSVPPNATAYGCLRHSPAHHRIPRARHREANRNFRGMRENERRNEDGSWRTMERTQLMPVAFGMQRSQHKWRRGQSVRVWVGSFEDGRRRTGVSAPWRWWRRGELWHGHATPLHRSVTLRTFRATTLGPWTPEADRDNECLKTTRGEKYSTSMKRNGGGKKSNESRFPALRIQHGVSA
ncbi:hypothetical protein B0H14DRAFT_3156258 [Mycena olivaceomarginata]|nr:hypothetical protein B0H14DRAFT_3156258 [Mycena olivaceomarginata]